MSGSKFSCANNVKVDRIPSASARYYPAAIKVSLIVVVLVLHLIYSTNPWESFAAYFKFRVPILYLPKGEEEGYSRYLLDQLTRQTEHKGTHASLYWNSYTLQSVGQDAGGHFRSCEAAPKLYPGRNVPGRSS